MVNKFTIMKIVLYKIQKKKQRFDKVNADNIFFLTNISRFDARFPNYISSETTFLVPRLTLKKEKRNSPNLEWGSASIFVFCLFCFCFSRHNDFVQVQVLRAGGNLFYLCNHKSLLHFSS